MIRKYGLVSWIGSWNRKQMFNGKQQKQQQNQIKKAVVDSNLQTVPN